MMDKNEIIEHLREIAKHAVHTIGEEPFIMSLDDGIAVHKAIEIIQQSRPERPKGKWILSDNQRSEETDNGNYRYICSNCFCSDIHGKSVQVPYCWNCGADMVSEEAM